ncbi:sugar phosphate isomerase/epimerase [Rhodobacter sp. KR11]|uniref:sugar phosphate isomerase/epimerase family protein n=1 Tax=Rhodobacter sp. KR11 TaxID=2974588 RepID=UPI0022217A15|nr:sugar phosphate isomerase/epimerase family protein [Rhodobacter sp. KR11]MCW1919017.1 sugar phosphate isomerase/epimerase [Rhodobacter sp. KR11]
MFGHRFATRINSFASAWDQPGKPTLRQMVERAAKVDGLTELDLNFPDHVPAPRETAAMITDCGLQLSGLAMRYYSNPAFKRGAFTNPDATVRREAIDLTKRGIDAAREMGAPMMTLWLGQDGFDYNLQCDYDRLWADEIAGLAEVAAHDPDCLVSIEYKPNEPRANSLLPDAATTLLAIDEVGAPNLGVTIDFAHALYANETPALAAAHILRRSRLLGLHLNDGYGKRDDGMMVASVHELATLELLRAVKHRFDGAIYFDTFPDASGLDPVAECAANIATVRRLLAKIDALEGSNALATAQAAQDPVAAHAALHFTP